MNLIPIDELVGIWVRVHEEALATYAHDDDLGWWRTALANLRPTPEDDEILDDDEEKR